MDLLSQYKQDHPEAFREQKRQPITDEYGRTYTGMIAWVMRLSGGRIRDARTASYALLIVIIAVGITALFLFFAGSGSSVPPPPPTPFQLEESDAVSNRKSGFTLIELLVVISIIGLLSSIVLTSVNSARAKARDARRITDLNQIRTALEFYFDANGFYPQSDCGWDCNGYRFSYTTSSWDALANDLLPYMPTLPKDPINSACPPWNDGCLSYTYGNVGRNSQRVQYDLTAHFEDTNNPNRCGVKGWRFYFDNRFWCAAFGGYDDQIYEASSN